MSDMNILRAMLDRAGVLYSVDDGGHIEANGAVFSMTSLGALLDIQGEEAEECECDDYDLNAASTYLTKAAAILEGVDDTDSADEMYKATGEALSLILDAQGEMP